MLALLLQNWDAPKLIQVVVTGIGLVSALGESLISSWESLIAAKSGIKLHQPWAELQPYPLGFINKQPQLQPALLEMLTRLVVSEALQDAKLFSPLPDCAVVIGSSRGYQASWENMARYFYERPQLPTPHSPLSTLHSPLSIWLDSLPHMNAIAAARQIGSTGIVLAPMAACATGIWAIAQAALLIQTGQCHRVIAGAVEAPITPLTITGFQQMGALAKTGAYPFDLYREGLVLAEGGAVFILESLELAQQRNANIYGEVLGFGLTADAYHTNAPEPEGKVAKLAIKHCLQRGGITAQDIDYIHAHGTGTILNDRMESFLIQELFPSSVTVSSTKGATGHTLGASGALGVAFSLMALQKQVLPPCVGLENPEFDLNFVTEVRDCEIERVMCFSFGFGGQNAVVALGNFREKL
ncbi:MAG: beta-ketoacyl-ACP synthase [Scytonematopsis contorta HA4267-MV1]|nr:beta-ketoacyl-ACP synthase [Scytonematopsis contorta HA4267-MV1]